VIFLNCVHHLSFICNLYNFHCVMYTSVCASCTEYAILCPMHIKLNLLHSSVTKYVIATIFNNMLKIIKHFGEAGI
jgi:hypothetical protein